MTENKGYHKRFFTVYRHLVLLRDKYKCQFCGHLDVSNHVHHIDGNKLSEDLSNMVTLCQKHHNTANHGNLKFNPITHKTMTVNLEEVKKLVDNGVLFY